MVTAVVAGPTWAREDVDLVSTHFREVASPAASGACAPFLFAAPGGLVTLSWVEPAGAGRHRLRFAAWRNGAWGEVRTAAEGDDWFVNWADVPSVVAAGDGRMAAHWLVKSGRGTYAYDVRVAQSFDGGATWGQPVTPHSDGTPTEHGFASLLYAGDVLHAVWLDGRKYADENLPDEMTLRAARIDRDGKLSGETELDPRTCDCCPTAIAPIEGGLIVAYRDRSPAEVRDISVVLYSDGEWEVPRAVAADGWKIDGCPVNGPALASDGERVVAAWFTMVAERGVVKSAWSRDGGRSFEGVEVISEGTAIGRVALGMEDAAAVTGWIADDKDGASLDVRVATAGGSPAVHHRAVRTSAARTSGYPRVVVAGGSLLIVWTQPGEVSRLRVAVAPLDALAGEAR
jgi:hypothetical protein